MTHPRQSDTGRVSRQRSWWTAALISGFFLTAWPPSASAQINPFTKYKGPILTKEDLASGHSAADKLLVEDQGEVGKSEDWAGPSSGNSGTISVLRAFQRQGMECRALRSEVRYKKPSTPTRTFNLDVCRLKTGQWKLM